MNNAAYPCAGSVLDLSTTSKNISEQADTQGSPDQESKNNADMIQEGGNDPHHLGDVLKSSHGQGGGLSNDREERDPNLKTNSGGHVIHRPRPYRQVRLAEHLWAVRGESEGHGPEPLSWPHPAATYSHQPRWLHTRPDSGEVLGLSPFPWYGFPGNDYQQPRFGFHGEGLVQHSGGLAATGGNISFSPYFRNSVIAGSTYSMFPSLLQYGSNACSSLYDTNYAHDASSLSNRFDASVSATVTPSVAKYPPVREPGPHGDLVTYGSLREQKPHGLNSESATRTYPNFKKDILAKMSDASKTSTNQTRTQLIPRSNTRRTCMNSQSAATPLVSLGLSTINDSVSSAEQLNPHASGFQSRSLQFGNNSAFSAPGGSGFRQTVAQCQETGWTGLDRNKTIMHQDGVNGGTSRLAQVSQSDSNSLYSVSAKTCNKNATNWKETSNFSLDGSLGNSVSRTVSGDCCRSFVNNNNTSLTSGSQAPVLAQTAVKEELNNDVQNMCGSEARGESSKEQAPVSEHHGRRFSGHRESWKEDDETCDESMNKTPASLLTKDCLDDFKLKVKQEEPATQDELAAVGPQTGVRRGALPDDSPDRTRPGHNDQIKCMYSTNALGVNVSNNWSRLNHEAQTETDAFTPRAAGTKKCFPGYTSHSCGVKPPVMSDAIKSGSTHFALGDITNCTRQFGNRITTNRSHFTQPWTPYNRAFSKPTSFASYHAVAGTPVPSEINSIPSRSLLTTEHWTLPNWSHRKSANVNPTVKTDFVLSNILLTQEERATYEKQREQNALSNSCHIMTEPNTPFAIALTSPTGNVPWGQENKPPNDIGHVSAASSKGCHEPWKTTETSFSKYTNPREQIASFSGSSTQTHIDRTPRGRACSSLDVNYKNAECKGMRQNKEALVTQTSTSESAKANPTLKCDDCHESFLSFSALLQHKGQHCGRHNGMSIHASDCVGKGCSLRGATENHRKQCECAHCLDCGRVFKSKYKVFTHSLRGCAMSSSAERSHLSPARACRNGASAQGRTSDLFSKNTPLSDRWYQDGGSTGVYTSSTGVYTSSTVPDTNVRAGGVLQSWPLHTNPACETSTGANTFGSFSVEPKPFINGLKPKISKQRDATSTRALYSSLHQDSSEKVKTAPKPGTLTSSLDNRNQAVHHCNARADTQCSQEKNSKCCIRQREETDVNDKGCSPSPPTLDNAEDENVTDGLLKPNCPHDSEGQITNITINENVIDTLLGIHETCPADSEVETETRGSMTTLTYLEGVNNRLISKEKENLINNSFQKQTTQDNPLTDFSKPHQATEWSERSQIEPSEIVEAVNEKTEQTEIQTGQTKRASECHDPSGKGTFASLAPPRSSAFIGLIPLNHAASPNRREMCFNSAARANKPSHENIASKPISPVSSPNCSHEPTLQTFARSLKRKLQDIEPQVVSSEALSSTSSYCKACDNSVARNDECLSAPGRNSSSCHCLFEHGNATKEGTLLLPSRKTNQVSLNADSDAEQQIPRTGRKEIAGAINVLSAQANIDRRRTVPNAGTVVKSYTPGPGTRTTNSKALNHEKSVTTTMKTNIAGKLKKKKKRKTKFSPPQKDRGLKEMSMFHFPVGAVRVQGPLWKSQDLAMSHVLPLKTATTYGRRDELLANGEKQTILYVLDANNKPVMLVKKENPNDLYGKTRVTLTTKATNVSTNGDENAVPRSRTQKSQKTETPAATTLVH